MCDQKETGLENRAMEQDEGFGFWLRSVAEVIDVAIRSQTADDRGTGRSRDGLTLGADGHFPSSPTRTRV